MTEWIDHDRAIKLICDARKIGVGAALQYLIKACAEGVRARERPCWASYALGGPTIPAAVWQGGHLEIESGELFPAGSTESYGAGVNGIIEIAEDDLREHLRKPAPRKRGRKPKVTPKVEQEVLALLDYHGAPNPNDPEWRAQAAVEEAIEERAGVSRTQARIHARRLIAEWETGKDR
jgi:hypothetical protein